MPRRSRLPAAFTRDSSQGLRNRFARGYAGSVSTWRLRSKNRATWKARLHNTNGCWPYANAQIGADQEQTAETQAHLAAIYARRIESQPRANY